MNFERYFTEQLHNHPSMQPQDVVKLCFQAAFGAEHLLSDVQRAEVWLRKETEETAAADIPLYEAISKKMCRVNLAAWKYHGLPVEWLFRIFLLSAAEQMEGEEIFLLYLKQAEECLKQEKKAFSMEEWQTYKEDYLAEGIRAVHHSEAYRKGEHPAYRIVNRKWMRILSVLQQAAKILGEKETCVIAIDGRAAAGKTTLSKDLQAVMEAEIIQMDDFFLPVALRTAERFAEAGGNVHRERFAEEVLPCVGKKEPFSYRIFDCGLMDYNGRKEIGIAHVRIVEGSYSQHPALGRYADITVFAHVEADLQMARIRERNGEKMAEMFRTRWIPLEEAYFAAYDVAAKADILLK